MPDAIKLIPDCKVSLDGARLSPELDASLAKVDVDLDVDLFGQCVLTFNDPTLKFTNGETFQAGAAIKVEIGFASNLTTVFEGEVVGLEPQFRRDLPIALRVVSQESLHRLALSQMTRSFENVDDAEVIKKIAQENGLTGEGPSGTKESLLQANVSDATLLRRLGQKRGNHLSIDGKKLILGPPPQGPSIAITPDEALRKIKVKIKAGAQVSEVAVHGYDSAKKQEFVGTAKGEGEVGEGTRDFGKSAKVSVAGGEHQPTDIATAEAMAKGRMRKLAEGHVTAQVELVGNPELVPGATVSVDRVGLVVDGTYRVERARHLFSRHGYWVSMAMVRTSKTTASKEAQKRRAQLEAGREKKREEEKKPEKEPPKKLVRPRWRRDTVKGKDRATLAVDAQNLADKNVELVLETNLDGSGWKEVAKASAKVSGGVASAIVELGPLGSDKLTKPKWTKAKDARHSHGDKAELQFDAATPDGVEVRILLEQLEGYSKTWEEVDEAVAKVQGGVVKSSFDLEHPHHEEKGRAHSELLSQPTWERKPAQHGETGTLRVAAPGLVDGRKVRFTVERLGPDGKWTVGQTAEGVVSNGAAAVSLDLEHAQGGPKKPDAHHLKKARWEKPKGKKAGKGADQEAAQEAAKEGELRACVDAPGADGHEVRFLFEHKDAAGWTQLGAQTVVVVGGKASAPLPKSLGAKLGKEMGKDLSRLRFRAEFVPDRSPQKLRFRAEPVADKGPRKLRFRGELLVPTDPSLTRLRASVEGGEAEPVQTGEAKGS